MNKTAPAKKTGKTTSKTPLLDAALAASPHKGPDGWNKEAATALQTELKSILVAVPTSDQAITLLAQYGPLAGWKETAKIIVKASGYGKINLTDPR